MTVPNLAVSYIRRGAAAIVERDWSAVADAMAEDFRMEDRRAGLGSTLDKDETVAMSRVIGDLGVDAIEVEVLEARGDDAALCRVTNKAQDFSVCTLCVVKTAPDGRALVLVVCDEGALDEARAALDVLSQQG